MQQTKNFKMADAISPYLAVSCGLIHMIQIDTAVAIRYVITIWLLNTSLSYVCKLNRDRNFSEDILHFMITCHLLYFPKKPRYTEFTPLKGTCLVLNITDFNSHDIVVMDSRFPHRTSHCSIKSYVVFTQTSRSKVFWLYSQNHTGK